MKAWKNGTLVLLIAGAAALTGCSSSDSPKKAIIDAMTKTNEASTFTYKGSFTMDDVRLLTPAGKSSTIDPMMLQALQILLPGAVIQVHGVVQQSPQRAELTMDAAFGVGDVKLNVSIPILMTADKLYIKVPDVPGLGIPAAIAGRFAVIDTRKLAEEQGGSHVPEGGEGTLKLGNEAITAVMNSLDEKTFFSKLDAADVKERPDGAQADRYVRMAIDSEHANTALTAISEQAIPKVLDLLLKNAAYLKTFQVTQEQLEGAKKDLTEDKLKQALQLDTVEVIGGISKDYLTYESGNILIGSPDGVNGWKLNMHFNLSYADMNEAVKFQYELPKDAVPVDQLMGK